MIIRESACFTVAQVEATWERADHIWLEIYEVGLGSPNLMARIWEQTKPVLPLM